MLSSLNNNTLFFFYLSHHIILFLIILALWCSQFHRRAEVLKGIRCKLQLLNGHIHRKGLIGESFRMNVPNHWGSAISFAFREETRWWVERLHETETLLDDFRKMVHQQDGKLIGIHHSISLEKRPFIDNASSYVSARSPCIMNSRMNIIIAHHLAILFPFRGMIACNHLHHMRVKEFEKVAHDHKLRQDYLVTVVEGAWWCHSIPHQNNLVEVGCLPASDHVFSKRAEISHREKERVVVHVNVLAFLPQSFRAQWQELCRPIFPSRQEDLSIWCKEGPTGHRKRPWTWHNLLSGKHICLPRIEAIASCDTLMRSSMTWVVPFHELKGPSPCPQTQEALLFHQVRKQCASSLDMAWTVQWTWQSTQQEGSFSSRSRWRCQCSWLNKNRILCRCSLIRCWFQLSTVECVEIYCTTTTPSWWSHNQARVWWGQSAPLPTRVPFAVFWEQRSFPLTDFPKQKTLCGSSNL